MLGLILAAIGLLLTTLACGTAAGVPEGAPSAPEPVQLTQIAPQEQPSMEAPEGEAEPPPTGGEGQPSEPPAMQSIPETRLLTFEWPGQIRKGDSDIIRLTLAVDESGTLTPTAVFDEHELALEQVQIEDLYDTHLIQAEARLDMAGIEALPSATIIQRLFPGQTAEFTWSIRTAEDGTFRGNVWLFLRYIPQEEGEELERLVFSRPLEIQTVNLLGLAGQPARILGAVGTALGSLLGLDDVFSWLRRLRKRKE
jgi:hypothetical protein